MVGRIGLTGLYRPPDGKKPSAHIVFVHGLFGHPHETWGSKPRHRSWSSLRSREGTSDAEFEIPILWPETLLPQVIPDAHILTWGYDADVGGFFSSAGQSTIHEHAGSLLSDLADLRGTPELRAVPLIFVAHSLGGIIVKDALNQSSSTEGTRLKEIAVATYGVVFMGTPHRGSKSASLGKIAYQITELATKRPNIRLLQGLEKHAETLDRVGDSFVQTIMKHELSIYSFREERETRKYAIFNTMVVDPDSAKIGHAKEECGIIPADHRNMTKFDRLDNVGFRRVSAQLRRWDEDIKSLHTNGFGDCLASLDDAKSRDRFQQVHEAFPKTFDWLFDLETTPFLAWLQDDDDYRHQPFWIRGKPGSGKSTLMKYALRDPRTRQGLLLGNDLEWIFSSYFFHNRGSQSQKSLLAMLKELLHSILSQNPVSLQALSSFYETLKREQKIHRPSWDIENLRKAIMTILTQSTYKVNLCLFLDALDEHAGENELLVELLMDMVAAAKANNGTVCLKICFASRPWDVFKKHFSGCPQLVIHEHTQHDIEVYTTQRLQKAVYATSPSPEEAELIAQIVSEASGVFIWVRLVMDLVVQEITDATPLAMLKHKVSELPSELGELYRLTVQRIKPSYHIETWIMYQVVLSALQPLSLRYLIRLINYNIHLYKLDRTDGWDVSSLNKADHLYELSHPEDQVRRLNSRSGGLLEVAQVSRQNQRGPDYVVSDQCVQFIHQTVKDAILQYGISLGFSIGEDNSAQDIYVTTGFEFLLNTCGIKADWSQEVLPSAFFYAKLSEQSAVSDPKRLDLIFRKIRFVIEHSVSIPDEVCARFDDLPKGRNEVVTAIAANLLQFVQTYFSKDGPIWQADLQRHFGPYLLSIAAVVPSMINHEICHIESSRMIQILINAGCNINPRPDQPIVQAFRDMLYQPSNPVHVSREELLSAFCLRYQFEEREGESELKIAETFLQNRASAETSLPIFDASHLRDISLFEYCVRYGSVKWVRFLLPHLPNLQSKVDGSTSMTLIDYAYLRQDTEIIQILKDHGFSAVQHPHPRGSSLVGNSVGYAGELLMSTSGGLGADLPVRLGPTVVDISSYT
ncbi:MAG: hypothetical protein Q9170_003978 [Blastenia crenularia]